MKNAVETIVHTFETLTLERVELLGQLYAEGAYFKDPFNDVQGRPEILRIYRHMYHTLEAPHFIITNCILDGQQCFLTWEFRFQFRRFRAGIGQVVMGGSHLVLDDAGRIRLHRDYWDTAEELYEKLPLLGSLMRWLRKRGTA